MPATRYAIYRQCGNRKPVFFGRKVYGVRMPGTAMPAVYGGDRARAITSRMNAIARAAGIDSVVFYAPYPID